MTTTHGRGFSGRLLRIHVRFLLLGGTRRYVPPEAHVLLVHMIWLGDKSKRAQEASYTAEELGLVQRDIGSIARYTVEMGGGIELLETALRVPPWKPMYAPCSRRSSPHAPNNLGPLVRRGTPIAAQAPWQATPAFKNSNSLATGTLTHGGND